ncbi:MAG: hypothetical protein JWP74_3852 [Marmoricola sp.]|nr:hypothetical protein [Marmoricola sp.]
MPHLSTYVALADRSEQTLAESLRAIGEGHANIADVFHMTGTLAKMSDQHREQLAPVVARYGEDDDVDEPERLHAAGLAEARDGEIGLLRDLQDLHVLATLVKTTWTVIAQGAQGLRDRELLDVSQAAMAQTDRQIRWFETRLKAAAPQALIVTPKPAAK